MIRTYAAIPGDRPLAVRHIGMRDNSMRIVLVDSGSGELAYTIVLDGVLKFFDRGVIGGGNILFYQHEVGSFGWDLPREVRDSSIQVDLRGAHAGLCVIARELAVRDARKPEDLNYPG